nr:RNA-directed DNA polymerase, eukaryota [Tanacetum cinerariifolium]
MDYRSDIEMDPVMGKLIQKLLLNQKCMNYLVRAYYSIFPKRNYKDDSCWSADSKSKTTEDIISNRSFMEVLVLNHYVLVKKVLFQRNARVQNAQPKKGNVGIVQNSFALVLKSNNSNAHSPSDFTPANVMDDSCTVGKDLSSSLMGKIKDINALSNLYVILADEGFDNVKISYLGGFWIIIDAGSVTVKEKMLKHVGVAYWFSELRLVDSYLVSDVRFIWISIKGLSIITWNNIVLAKNVSQWGTLADILNKNKETEEPKESKGEDPTFPPGFTPKDVEDKICEDVADNVSNLNLTLHSNKEGVSSGKYGSSRSFKLKYVGSILEVMEELVEIGQVMGYNMEGCSKNIKAIIGFPGDLQYNVNFCAIKETKSENTDLFSIKSLWGNFSFDFAFSPSVRLYGGILCVWDLNMFFKDNVTISDSFVVVRGTWISSSTKMMIISVYALQDVSKRKSSWEYINQLIDLWEGYSYTWALKSASKMSKLDRFLISEGLLSVYPLLFALYLDRRLSDHMPIIMRDYVVEFGPTPFRVFQSWFTKDGFDKLFEDTWKNTSFVESNKISLIRKKFQALKVSIKAWCKEDMHRSNESRLSIQSWISDLDKMLDKGTSNDDIINERALLLNDLHAINKCHSSNMDQKAKIRWAIEGNENSKYFHGVGDEEVVVGEGVVVTSSSLEMFTNNYLGGIMVSLIFFEGLEEVDVVEFIVELFEEDDKRNKKYGLFN